MYRPNELIVVALSHCASGTPQTPSLVSSSNCGLQLDKGIEGTFGANTVEIVEPQGFIDPCSLNSLMQHSFSSAEGLVDLILFAFKSGEGQRLVLFDTLRLLGADLLNARLKFDVLAKLLFKPGGHHLLG